MALYAWLMLLYHLAGKELTGGLLGICCERLDGHTRLRYDCWKLVVHTWTLHDHSLNMLAQILILNPEPQPSSKILEVGNPHLQY